MKNDSVYIFGLLDFQPRDPVILKTKESMTKRHGSNPRSLTYCWWFRNPANQLRLVVYPIIFRVSAPSQVVQDFSHQQYPLKIDG